MSELKATPGPWEASLEAVRFVIQTDAPIGKRALAYTGGSEPANPFNAYLIAAAPELYAALLLCKGHADNLPSEPEWLGVAAQQIADIATAALRKARGEA
jgi:hypothetical protein